MSLLAQVLAYLLQWVLTLGGKALYEWTNDYIDKQKQEKKEKENLKKYKEAKKNGSDDKILDAERDILNNN